MLEHSVEKGQSFLVWPAGGVPANGSGEPRDDETQRSQAVQLRIPLLGHHQVENAATAYAALQTAARSGIPIDEQAVQAGFARVNWPARFEILRPDPPLVVDAAHNRDSALQLRRTLEEYFPGKPVILIFGASEDKDIQGMFAELLPYTRQVVATRSYHPRALEPEALEELARPYNTPVLTTGSVEEALDEALRLAGSDALVLAAGSVFVAAGVREVWLQKQKKTIPQE
jgi:dihydrofolate synthase/folylpolyglutamate synthase